MNRDFLKLAVIIVFLAVGKIITAQTADKALNVGDKAIDFTLTNAQGKNVTLYSELKKGPIVLTWYRGGWCPYCNRALSALQDVLPEIKSLGANLIAISPELPDKSLSTAEKSNSNFEILSDVDNRVGKSYGIVFKLDKETEKRYESGFGLSNYNGNKDGELPIPATYVIGVDGIIKYAFVDEDYKKRAEPATIISELKKLNSDSSNKLAVIWTSDDPYVAKRVALMYTHAAARNKWFNDVTLIIWGPSAKLIAEDTELQDKIKQMMKDGIKVEACSACSNAYGTTDKLKELGYDVKPMGIPLTNYLKNDVKVLTF